MTDLDLARQLVAYVDATTSPVSPAVDRPAEVVVLGSSGEPPTRRWILVAAAIAVAVLVGALIVAGARDDGAIQELDDDTAPSTSVAPRLAEAVELAERYFEAWSNNDDQSVLELSASPAERADQERNAIRWWFLTGLRDEGRAAWASEACGVASGGVQPDAVRVDCPIRVADPVARALGLDVLTWSATVDADGLVTRAAEPVGDDLRTYSPVWQAYADYIGRFRPDERGCDPADRAPDSVLVQSGLALDGRCATTLVVLADTVALWLAHGDDAPELSITALAGIWDNTFGFDSLVAEFGDDGTFTIGNSGGLDAAGAFAFGTIDLDGETLTFIVDEASSNCAGEVWTWRVSIPVDGLLEVDVADNGGCVDESAHWQWTRLTPSSPAGLALRPVVGAAEAGSEPAGRMGDIWHLVGTSEVLGVGPAGQYRLVRHGVTVDRGRLTVAEPGRWQFVSDGSGECRSGETWLWNDVTVAAGSLERGSPHEVVLRTPSSPRCAGDEGPAEWRRVAPARP